MKHAGLCLFALVMAAIPLRTMAAKEQPPCRPLIREYTVDPPWYRDLKDYSLTLRMGLGAPGADSESGLAITMKVMALASGPSFKEIDSMGLIATTYCSADSLYRVQPGFFTYTVEHWNAVSLGTGDNPLAGFEADQPWQFPAIKSLLCPSENLANTYRLEGEEDLVVGDTLRRCEVFVPCEGAENPLRKIWLDPQLGMFLKTTSGLASADTSSMSVTIQVVELSLNSELSPEDFVFRPPEGFRRAASQEKSYVRNSLEGQTMADLDLVDLAGIPVNTSSWRGKVIVMDFWATWCPPCRRSLPHLQKLARKYGDRIRVVGITNESAHTVKRFFANEPSPYPILLDPSEKAETAYQVQNLPTLFVLDEDGQIRDHFVGYIEEEVLFETVAGALAEN